jgi:hypothetical protein
MSDEVENEWVWQGFYGPTDLVQSEKLLVETLPASLIGVIIPPPGQGVVAINVDGTESMFAIQTRRKAPLSAPEGLSVARPEIVGRLVGA